MAKALGVHASTFHSSSPHIDQYASTHFIIGVVCEQALNCSWTGLNTKAGDMITVQVKSANRTIDAAKRPTKIYITLHSDNILEIRDSGTSGYD